MVLFCVAGILAANALRVEPDALCCGWKSTPLASLAVSDDVSVTFYLKETNSALVEEAALAVSDPASSRYVCACPYVSVFVCVRVFLCLRVLTQHHPTPYHRCTH